MIGIAVGAGIQIAATLGRGAQVLVGALRTMGTMAAPLLKTAGTRAFITAESGLIQLGKGLRSGAGAVKSAAGRAYLSSSERQEAELRGEYNEGFFYHYGDTSRLQALSGERMLMVETDTGTHEVMLDPYTGEYAAFDTTSGELGRQEAGLGGPSNIRSFLSRLRGMYMSREERYKAEARGEYRESFFSKYIGSTFTHRYEAVEDVMRELESGDPRVLAEYGIEPGSGVGIQELYALVSGVNSGSSSQVTSPIDTPYGYDRRRAKRFESIQETLETSDDIFERLTALMKREYYEQCGYDFDAILELYRSRTS